MPAAPTEQSADRLGRPVKRRGAARVVIVADDMVLLQGDTDPGVWAVRIDVQKTG